MKPESFEKLQIDENVELCTKAIDHLMRALLFDDTENSIYFWRAEAFRVRALSRKLGRKNFAEHQHGGCLPKPREDGLRNRAAKKLETADLRAGLGDVDHVLRFFDPHHLEGAAAAAMAWQLRGRIRASLKNPDYWKDFEMAEKLDPSCAITYLLWARCLWREKRWKEALVQFNKGLDHIHDDEVRAAFEGEIQNLKDQQAEWTDWQEKEDARCKCTVM